LEVIEAVVLFSVPTEKVKVVIHPQSIIHSMVEYVDSSVMAQLSKPDMRLPITYALFWPERVESDFGEIDFDELGQLTFEKPDVRKFRALKLAFEVAETGGTAPAIFNAANEIAVEAFLQKAVKFTGITDIIEGVVEKLDVVSEPDLNDILESDRKARQAAKNIVGRS
ncbi:1-deoxy-D-xylulose-5-phosphate reductoisomerase, partial [bacterium]|nr:1-deoxy-D-xylulose-5-phosphate reductoisomerase [bacterium]